MRHGKPRHVNHFIAVQDQIQIDGARGELIGSLASELPLDSQQRLENGGRGECRLPDCGGVQEHRLRRADADRFRVVEGGDTQLRNEAAKRSYGAVKMCLSVAKVAPQRNGNSRALLQPARGQHAADSLSAAGAATEQIL